jgi:glucose/arabinose dehydrogenase
VSVISLCWSCHASDEVPLTPSLPSDDTTAVVSEPPVGEAGEKHGEDMSVARGGGGFELVTVAEGLSEGVGFAFAPGERIYIVEKRGLVRLVRHGRLSAQPVIDISREVNTAQDRGLLGIAVHPRFPELPYLYLLYAYDPPQVWDVEQLPTNNAAADGNGARASRLIRVEADPATDYATARPETAKVLLGTGSTFENINGLDMRNDYERTACGNRGAYARDCLPADENSHAVGTVTFGPDGMLYVGNGDGCDYVAPRQACTRALDVDSLAGKILRIDPLSGDAPADNPFFDGDPQSNRSKVYQLGLRNPFRFSFDAPTNSLYVGDVGWNEWEEINRGGPGANFGWPCYEGGNGVAIDQPGYQDMPVCTELRSSGSPITPALYAYGHAGPQGNSVLVGDVYRGTSYPPLYQGALFFTDYSTRQLRFIAFDREGNVESSQLVVGPVGFLTQISADPVSRDLYMMRIGSSPEMPGSVLERLVFRGYGDGPDPGLFSMRSRATGACVEVLSNEAGLPTTAETRACVDAPPQHVAFELLQGDVYRLHPESGQKSLTSVLRAEGRGELSFEQTADYAAQRFRAYPLRGGYQLIDDASELCLTSHVSAPSEALSLQRCADVDHQLFELSSIDNQVPVLDPIEDRVSTVGDGVQLTLSGRDPEGVDLTWFATGLPPGLSLDPRSGVIMGSLTKPGSHRVQVRATDGQLRTAQTFSWTVRDDQLPDVVIDAPAEGDRITVGELVRFAGHATDSNGSRIPAYSLFWELYTHHYEHIHFGGLPDTRGDSGTFLGLDHGDNTAYELCLNASDGAGRLGRACRVLRPREVELTLDTEPSGLLVSWEGVAHRTPYTVTTQVNALRNIVVAPEQEGYLFSQWTTGEPASRWITVASVPERLVARYVPKP